MASPTTTTTTTRPDPDPNPAPDRAPQDGDAAPAKSGDPESKPKSDEEIPSMEQPVKRNAAALHKKADELIQQLLTRYNSLLARAAEDPAEEYSRSAMRELAIVQDAGAIISATQDLSVFIRDLQELWLFGCLDTLLEGVGGEVHTRRAREMAGVVEKLVRLEGKEYVRPVEEEEEEEEGEGDGVQVKVEGGEGRGT